MEFGSQYNFGVSVLFFSKKELPKTEKNNETHMQKKNNYSENKKVCNLNIVFGFDNFFRGSLC